jgi:hypothetical protein
MTSDRIVAWRVTARGFPGAGIYAAVTADRAKFLASDAIRDAGYRIAWIDLEVRRAPEFDAWIAGQAPGRGWDEDYARRCMAEDARERPQSAPGAISGGEMGNLP